MKLLEKSIIELNKMLKNKQIKPIDIVNEFEEKFMVNDLNAFIGLNFESIKKRALELEEKEVDNLLFGIPVAIKDNIVTKDFKTTCASLMLCNFYPDYNATVVEKLIEKGVIIIGKTNMDEFAMGSTGETSFFAPAKNPINKKLVPGGSSSGSAAAVAGNLVPLALGSDTGGSIRQPSSFCGIVGLKPTYGSVSRYGLIAFASSLDQIGPMSRSVIENAVLFEAIKGMDKRDLTSSDKSDFKVENLNPNKKYKIAVPNYYLSDIVSKNIVTKIQEVIKILEENGHKINYIDIPYLDYSVPLYQVIALAEASSNLARFDGLKYGYKVKEYTDYNDFYIKNRTAAFGDEVKRRIMVGTYVLSGETADKYYYKALAIRNQLTKNLNKVFEEYDLIIGPTTTSVAYEFNIKKTSNESFGDDILTIPANMSGLPALSVPIGTVDNLPVGMQIMGNYFKEEDIYNLALFIEGKVGVKNV